MFCFYKIKNFQHHNKKEAKKIMEWEHGLIFHHERMKRDACSVFIIFHLTFFC